MKTSQLLKENQDKDPIVFKLALDLAGLDLDETAEKCFALFTTFDLLNETGLKLIQEKGKELYALLPIMQELAEVNQLKEASLKLLCNCKFLPQLAELLPLLNAAKVKIDHKLLSLLCATTSLAFLVDVSQILRATGFLDEQKILMFLEMDLDFFINIIPILKELQVNQALTENDIQWICTSQNFIFIVSLKQALELLAAHHLLNIKIINHLLENDFNIFKFHKVMMYLNKAGILNEETINSYLTHMPPLRHPIFALLERLTQLDFALEPEWFKIITSLSARNIQRLNELISNFINSQLFDRDIFKEALERIAFNFPLVEEAAVMKNSRKKTGLSRSQLIINKQLEVFIEHRAEKDYSKGGQGLVKEGYATLDSEDPIYLIKKLLKENRKTACREVNFHRLLGRQAFYFSRGEKISIVTTWQRGRSLSSFSSTQLEEEPLNKRLSCLISGLSDLNVLHRHYRVHGDIKCDNFILNFKQVTMKLIDFGSSHKNGSTQCYAVTNQYCDLQAKLRASSSFYDDMYAMGIVTACLFPELFSVYFNKNDINVVLIKNSPLSLLEQALIALVRAMMRFNCKKRCTSENALDFCHELLVHFSRLNEGQLSELIASFIDPAVATKEDLFRHALRV